MMVFVCVFGGSLVECRLECHHLGLGVSSRRPQEGLLELDETPFSKEDLRSDSAQQLVEAKAEYSLAPDDQTQKA